MKTITNATIYKCEHCNKITDNAGAMTLHERACKKNPRNKPQCWFEYCKHYNETEEEVELVKDYSGGGYDEAGNCVEPWKLSGKVKVRICEACGKKLYTPLLGRWKKEILEKDKEWMQMPTMADEMCPYWGTFIGEEE